MLTLDFTGKVVLVTGGSAGIGLAIGRLFRDAGATVTVTGTQPRDRYDADFAGLHFAQSCPSSDAKNEVVVYLVKLIPTALVLQVFKALQQTCARWN